MKALVYELGTGKAKGERIEETSPWMSTPTYKEAMVRQRQFMRAHEYIFIHRCAKAERTASSSSQSTAGKSTSKSRPKRESAPASLIDGQPAPTLK